MAREAGRIYCQPAQTQRQSVPDPDPDIAARTLALPDRVSRSEQLGKRVSPHAGRRRRASVDAGAHNGEFFLLQ